MRQVSRKLGAPQNGMCHIIDNVATKLKCPSFCKVEMSHLAVSEHGWAGRRLHISEPGPAMLTLLFCGA